MYRAAVPVYLRSLGLGMIPTPSLVCELPPHTELLSEEQQELGNWASLQGWKMTSSVDLHVTNIDQSIPKAR